MKSMLLLIGLLTASSASASEIMTCNNPATGAMISVSIAENHTDQPVNENPQYFLNNTLASNLKSQLGSNVNIQGYGKIVEEGSWFSFESGDLLLTDKNMNSSEQGNAYKLSYGSAVFYFNPGECSSSGT